MTYINSKHFNFKMLSYLTLDTFTFKFFINNNHLYFLNVL